VGALLGGAAGEAFGLPAVYIGAAATIVGMACLLTATGLWRASPAAPGSSA
jgi:hypothetical protein